MAKTPTKGRAASAGPTARKRVASVPAEQSAATTRLAVFYAWQSDLCEAANRYGIRDGLRAAKKALKSKVGLVIDEATRDSPGSPNIPSKIVEKIRRCDIFVADVTTITKSSPGGRPCANPNVIFELGYATALVGWDRIILMVNGKVSPVSDLPFDFDRHRAMIYQHDEAPTSDQKATLAHALTVGIETIVRHDPPRPRDLESLSPAEIRRQRDVTNIRWALRQIHQPSLDDFVEAMPYQFQDRIIWYFESFKGVITNSLFHISDPQTAELFEDMLDGWERALSYDEHFRQSSNASLYIWDGDRDPKSAKAEAKIRKAIRKLESARQAILQKVRVTYVEIDIAETNKAAFEARRAHLES